MKEERAGNKDKFIQEIQENLKSAGEIISRTREKKILIKDLDDSIKYEDIISALAHELKCNPSEIKTSRSSSSSSGNQN